MAIWEWILAALLIVKLILIVVTLISPPKFVKEWLSSHFELHSKLNEKVVTVTLDEKTLKGEDKKQVIDYFNHATFLKKYDVAPRRGQRAPLVIETLKGKHHIRFSLYFYNDRVDVYKAFKNKVTAYNLSPDNLPEQFSQKVSVL